MVMTGKQQSQIITANMWQMLNIVRRTFSGSEVSKEAGPWRKGALKNALGPLQGDFDENEDLIIDLSHSQRPLSQPEISKLLKVSAQLVGVTNAAILLMIYSFVGRCRK